MESGIVGRELGFDYLSTVEEMAVGLGLVGTIFEKSDGSIKIIAEGEEKDLLRLTEDLNKVGFNHRGENFYIKWKEPTGEFTDFSISGIK